MKETLVIVDRQKDFNDPLGSLYVLGAEDTELNTLKYIERNSDRIKEVIFTVDWHLPSDKSFERNGGTWPDHCLQFSEGAGISDVLYKVCIEHNIPIQIFRKGEVSTHEEYGAFEIMSRRGDNLVLLNNYIMDSCVQVTTNNVVVCGLAGDYCVKETIKNLLEHSKTTGLFNVSVFKDGISSIDSGETLERFINENNLNVVS